MPDRTRKTTTRTELVHGVPTDARNALTIDPAQKWRKNRKSTIESPNRSVYVPLRLACFAVRGSLFLPVRTESTLLFDSVCATELLFFLRRTSTTSPLLLIGALAVLTSVKIMPAGDRRQDENGGVQFCRYRDLLKGRQKSVFLHATKHPGY